MPICAAIRSTFLRGHHLGDRCDHRAVDPRVAHEQVLGEVAAAPELGDAQVDGADARHEAAFTIAVSLVAISACALRLGVHDLVDERLCHDADELLDVGHPVIKSGDFIYLWYSLL